MDFAARTTMARVTVSKIAVELVPAEPYLRRVILLAPGSPVMNVAIDEAGDAIAGCRDYQWSPLPQGFPVPPFHLLPGQFMWAVADTPGQAPITVICEYLEGPVVPAAAAAPAPTTPTPDGGA
jgi:hypothetical protein